MGNARNANVLIKGDCIMALFSYQSVTESGRLMTGTVEASGPEQAAQMLTEMRLRVNTIEKVKDRPPQTPVGRNEFLLFNQQLASLTQAGIPLERGLRELAADAGSGKMTRLINEITDDLERGVSLDEAVEKRKSHFPPLYSQILKAGLRTGRLSEMLTCLNRHLEVELQTRRIITEAMCYPGVVLMLMAVILTFLLVVLVPPFSEMINDMSWSGLPYPTRLVFSLSRYVWHFWMAAGIAVAAAVILWRTLSASAAGRRWRERVILRIPLIGRVYESSLLARLAEAMAVLTAAGCTLPMMVRLAGQSSRSELMKSDCTLLADQLEQGASIFESGMGCRLIPRLYLYAMQLAAQRNELYDSLTNLGQMYTQQTLARQGRTRALLMPGMIIIIGGIVGGVVFSMFLPLVTIITVMM